MRRDHARAARVARALVDGALLSASFAVAYELRYRLFPASSRPESLADHFGSNGWMLALGVASWTASLYAWGGYDTLRGQTAAAPWRSVLAAALPVSMVLSAAVFLQQISHFSRGIFALFVAVSVLALGLARSLGQLGLLALAGDAEHARRRVLVVGTGSDARRYARSLQRGPAPVAVVGFVGADDPETGESLPGPWLGGLARLNTLVDEGAIDEVTFALPPEELERAGDAMWHCEQVGVEVRVVANFFALYLSRTQVELVGGLPVLAYVPTPSYRFQFFLKRVLDLTLASLGLLVLSPVMAAVALGVRLSSPGPVLFRQTRSGLFGRPFTFLKFRSMYQDAEQRRADLEPRNEMRGPVFKLRDDPRITPFGRAIRKLSLDELPQLWNVVRGEMSLVGPRPPLPREVAQYQRWQRRRLSMRPGLTCIWQVSGRNEIPFDRWMEMDLRYIDEWSLWLDLRILLRTLPAVLGGRGAS